MDGMHGLELGTTFRTNLEYYSGYPDGAGANKRDTTVWAIPLLINN